MRVYLPAGVIALTIAIAGFWPTYFGPLFRGTVQALPIIHIHAAVFVVWLLLVITQAALAATGRTALHIRIGEVGLYFGLAVIAVGIITAFALFAARIEAGHVREAQDKLFVPLTDMMVFAPFFAAAWLYKRRPEIHKRLIIVATTILLIAAVHRMTFLGPRPVAAPTLLAVWLAPIYLGMTADLIKRRIVHPVYLAGIAAILYLKFLRVPLFQSDAWKSFAEWLTTFYV
jgi:hypothetical protein